MRHALGKAIGFVMSVCVAVAIAPRLEADGACYTATGCTVTDSMTCMSKLGGSFKGDGTTCGASLQKIGTYPTPTPTPSTTTGACTSLRGCTVTTGIQCALQGGSFQGPGTVCTGTGTCSVTAYGLSNAVALSLGTGFSPSVVTVANSAGTQVAGVRSPQPVTVPVPVVSGGAVIQPPNEYLVSSTAIANGAAYTVTVSGVDASGSPCTATASFSTPGLSVPPGNVAQGTGSTLTWTAPGVSYLVASYTVRSGSSSSGPFGTVVASGVTGTTFSIPSSSTGPYYVVSSVNSAGEGPASAPVQVSGSAPAGWTNTAYQAWDIAVGANGTVWYTKLDRTIWRVVNGAPQQMPGGATRIAVDPGGNAWVVNDGYQIYQWTGSTWVLRPGQATDIGVGANGKVWILGMDNVPASWDGTTWKPLSGGGSRLAVDASGNPWVTNAGNQIWRYTGTTWQLLSGAASDVSAGPDGSVYVLGMSYGPGGSQIWRWDGGTGWIIENGVFGGAVAAGSGAHAWVARTPDSNLPVITR